MIIVDSQEKSAELFEVLEYMGIAYKKAEICFYSCAICGANFFMEHPQQCGCSSGKSVWIREQAGDFTNERGSFLLERKSEKDFWGSMVSKRIYKQLKKMANNFKGWKVLAVEGFLSNVCLQHPGKEAWIESMPSVAMQYGVNFLQCDDIESLIKQVIWLDRKSGTSPKIRMEITDKFKGYDDHLKMICKLHDVGKRKGKVLLNEFGSVIGVFDAILKSKILYTRTGNPKGVSGPFASIKGFGTKFIDKNQKLLLTELEKYKLDD